MNILLRNALFEGMDNTAETLEYLKTLGYSDTEIEESFANAVEAQMMESRKSAYSTESDPLFLEALRKDAAGDVEGAELARVKALEAVDAIKVRYPLA